MEETGVFDATDEDGVRLVVQNHLDDEATAQINGGATFLLTSPMRVRLVQTLGGSFDAAPAPDGYMVTIDAEGNVMASGDKAAAVAEIAERAIAAVLAPTGAHLRRQLEGMSEELALARDELAAQAHRVLELQAGNELLQQQAQDLAQAKYALQQNRRDNTNVRNAINVLIDDLVTLRGHLQLEREARSKAETLAERMRASANDRGEALVELERERNVLKAALRSLVAELCDASTGEPVESCFTQAQAAEVVAAAREALEPAE